MLYEVITQMLDLRHAIDDVVERLAGNRSVDAELIGKADDFRQAPAMEVRYAEIAHLALPVV